MNRQNNSEDYDSGVEEENDASLMNVQQIGRNNILPQFVQEAKWKMPELVIEVEGKERFLGEFTREQIRELVLEGQNEWTSPRILDLDLRDEILPTLIPVFELLDQPRKFGLMIAQFMQDREYFTEHFMPMLKERNDDAKLVGNGQNRLMMNNFQAAIFFGLFNFCGANLIVEHPQNGNGPRNHRLTFLNNCRDRINASGIGLRQNGTIEDYMPANFIPIMMRANYAQRYEMVLRRIALQKQQKAQQRKLEKMAKAQNEMNAAVNGTAITAAIGTGFRPMNTASSYIQSTSGGAGGSSANPMAGTGLNGTASSANNEIGSKNIGD